MRSAATTPDAYLDQLPPDRRAALAAVRDVIRANLPNGYEEAMGSGMIVYGVPTTRLILPNKQALWYAALGAQKNYNSLYLMSVYANKTQLQRLRDAFAKAGKKLDMGKSCIRFQHADDLQLEAIGQVIASVPVEKWISIFNESRRKPSSRKNA
ncbi:MAG TPA: DUF1801 domain-containing protein [Gemmatimonadaceae bacterium]|nr:DUF1801 domain-containing protein [Gemmatimonadaceae bacterium]